MQLGHAVEVEVVGHHRRPALFGEQYQLIVHLGHAVDVVIDDPHRGPAALLELAQNLQAAPAPVATQHLGRVGHVLELVQHEPWHEHRALDEARLADVEDAAIDDHAGIEQDLAA